MQILNHKGSHVELTFPPSYAHIWGAANGCPAYVHKIKQHPYASSAAAEEGKKEHASGASAMLKMKTEMLRGGTLTVAHESPAVMMYLQDVATVVSGLKDMRDDCIKVEERLYMSNIHQHCKGDVDLSIAITGALHIWDFKNGHTSVEVYKNLQLVCYASELLRQFGATPTHYNPDFRIHFHIVQPNGHHKDGPCREWVCTPRELFDMECQLREAAKIADSPQVFTRSGNHCLYCVGRLGCPAGAKSADVVLDYIDGMDVAKYTPENLGCELVTLTRASVALKSRLTAVTTQLESAMADGAQVTNWRMGVDPGNMYWIDGGQSAMMLDAMGFNVLNAPQLCTPLQAIKAGVPEELVHSMAKRSSKPKLLLDDGEWAKKEINNGSK